MRETPALIDSGRSLFRSNSGRWAAERMITAIREGREVTTQELRTLDLLREDQWKEFDNKIVEGAFMRLRAVQDLIQAGLTRSIANGFGKTVFEYEKMSDLEEALVSMDGRARSNNDALDFSDAGIPLPIIHKDWHFNIRKLAASRNRGGPALDTVHARVAGRKIAEKLEYMLFNGGPQFLGLPIYGYRTTPGRAQLTFESTGNSWDNPAKTGDQAITDIQAGIAALEARGFYGPYWVYVPSGFSPFMERDYKAASDKTIRTRLLEIDRVDSIRVVDALAADEMIMLQPTADVVELLEAEPYQTIQWDIDGGMAVNFKALTIQVPLLRTNADDETGIAHFTVA